MHRDDDTAPLPVDPDLAPEDPAEPSEAHVRALHPIRRSRDHGVLLATMAGGYLGTAARFLATEAWSASEGAFPATTFAINTSGAFLLGLTLATLLARHPTNRLLRPFLCTGVLGGWTTMSALAVDLVTLTDDGHAVVAVAYATATVAAGLASAWFGITAARRLTSRVPC